MFEIFKHFEGRELIDTLGVVKGKGRPSGDEWLDGEIVVNLCGPSKKDSEDKIFLQMKTRNIFPSGRPLEIVLSLEQAKELSSILDEASKK